MKNQLIRGACFGLLFSLAFVGCTSGSGTSSSSTTTAAPSSVTQLPSVSSLVKTGSIGSTLELKGTVSGTPPLLKEITSSSADTLFWNGLIATINSAKAATSAQANAFWDGDANSSGEGGCRMAETVGYSFQNIVSGGTSLCYMQNLPSASNGVAITSGSVTDPTKLFDQGASSKTIQVKVSNMSQGGDSTGSEDVFVKVFGTGSTEGSAGYAADLWFCRSGSINGYEMIRIDASNVLTSTNVDKETQQGQTNTFVGIISAPLTKDSSGKFTFDSTKTRSAQVYFTPGSSATFLGSVGIDSTGLLTAREYQTGSFNNGPSSTFKGAVFANYTGDTMETLRFTTAGFAVNFDNGGGASGTETVIGAAEYHDTKYVSVSTGSLLDSAKAERFKDSIYTGATSTYTTLVSAMSGYNCTTTPDVVATVDFNQSAPQAVATQCQDNFQDMNFCDSQAINTARQYVMTSEMQNSCATTNCGDDFSCQLYADSNPNNSAGITTANAKCSNGCCAKSQ